RNAKTPKHYSAPTTHAPRDSTGRHRTTWVASTFNERRPNGTPRILPQRQPRLRNTLDTRTQHGLDIPRHSHHRNAHPPLLARIRLHPHHSIQLLRPINRTHTPRNSRQRPSPNPPRNRWPTRLGKKKAPKRKPANSAIRRKPVRRPNLVPYHQQNHEATRPR